WPRPMRALPGPRLAYRDATWLLEQRCVGWNFFVAQVSVHADDIVAFEQEHRARDKRALFANENRHPTVDTERSLEVCGVVPEWFFRASPMIKELCLAPELQPEQLRWEALIFGMIREDGKTNDERLRPVDGVVALLRRKVDNPRVWFVDHDEPMDIVFAIESLLDPR